MNLVELSQKAVAAMGFDRLNAMQEKMLETAVSGSNIVLLSPTGSGKTVAFLLGLMATAFVVDEPRLAMVIVPSRELAQQIAEVARKLGLRTVLCYGGHDPRIECQRLEAISGERALIIGTSGRLKDHMERGRIQTQRISHLVLDEFDKMLELGFEEELKYIVGGLKAVRQTFLTSATHATPIAPWLNMKPYQQLDFTRPTQGLKVYQFRSPIADKLDALTDLLHAIFTSDTTGQVIVFSNYRESSERIAHHLCEQGIPSALYHGGMDQSLRDKAVIRLRTQSVRVMVATDLASRGLDISEVSHIIHYHLPADLETLTHRNGRTARNGTTGTAYMIVGPNEFLPDFLGDNIPFFNTHSTLPTPHSPEGVFTLVYIGRGKKHKISKGDILGFFTKNGGIDGSKIGRIEVTDQCSYCAISSDVVHSVLDRVHGLKIKGEKTIYKIVEGN